MTESHDIEPALTDEQWASLLADRKRLQVSGDGAVVGAFSPAAAIAINNELLPYEDNRRITLAHVELLRDLAVRVDRSAPGAAEAIRKAEAFADALNAYLPPAHRR